VGAEIELQIINSSWRSHSSLAEMMDAENLSSPHAFVFEKDFIGTWKIEKEVFKHFTIMLK
jgi:hypothetical protein